MSGVQSEIFRAKADIFIPLEYVFNLEKKYKGLDRPPNEHLTFMRLIRRY